MKNFFVSLIVILASLTVSAKSIDKTAVVATLTGYEQGIAMVALLADGRLQVVPADKSSSRVVTITLTSAASQKVFGLASAIANTELEEIKRKIVCRAMQKPSLSKLSVSSFDEESGDFTGDLRLTLTSAHCSQQQVVTPVLPYAVQAAQELRSVLLILALNTVK